MKIDAHQHFWMYAPEHYRWIRTDVLKHDFMPDDLTPLLAATGFDGTVAVQARSMAKETAWLLELADTYPFIVGVVGWLDVAGGDPDNEALHAQVERFSAHPKFCGVRCGIQTKPETAKPTAAFLRGLQTLTDFDKTFDLLILPSQLPLACAVAEAMPDLRFVLDHIANPTIDGTIAPEWESGIRELAAHPNVACKVSGMVTRYEPKPLPDVPLLSSFKPYLDVIFDAFGPERLLIGSDWPVCTQAAGYARTMGIVTAYVEQLSPSDQAAVLGETAKQVYKIP